MFLLAQVFSVVGAALLLWSTFSKTKEKMLQIQILDASANAIADALLGGWAGVMLNVVAIVRNITIVNGNGKIKKSVIACLMAATLLISFLFDGVGILPLIASLEYTLVVSKGDLLKSKVALAINLFLWMFYDISIKSYGVAIADLIILASTIKQITDISNQKGLNERAVQIKFGQGEKAGDE